MLPPFPDSLTKVRCEQNPWKPSFQNYLETDTVHTYYKDLADKQRTKNILVHLPFLFQTIEDILSHLGSFLSGKEGTLTQQIYHLQEH
jgi:hypothetical protein